MEGDVIQISTRYADNFPRFRVLRIALYYPDWCEFERTPLYRELMEYLHKIETRSTPYKTKQAED